MQTTDINNLKFGKYRAVVESVDHPEKLLLAQIRLLGEWNNLQIEQLPWAEYLCPVGSRLNDGEFKPCAVGDLVWIEFDGGDTRYPIIVGSCFTAPNKIPNLPNEAFAGDSYQHKRTASQPKPSPAQYHKDWINGQFGILVERTAEGAIRATHKATGSAIEITNLGEIVIHAENDLYESTSKNKLLEAALNITVKGSKQIHIDSAEANVKITAASNCTIDAPTIALNGGAGVITGECICSFTGAPHSDMSATVTAGK